MSQPISILHHPVVFSMRFVAKISTAVFLGSCLTTSVMNCPFYKVSEVTRHVYTEWKASFVDASTVQLASSAVASTCSSLLFYLPEEKDRNLEILLSAGLFFAVMPISYAFSCQSFYRVFDEVVDKNSEATEKLINHFTRFNRLRKLFAIAGSALLFYRL